MNVANYYLNFLYKAGCEYAFGVPGRGIMPFWQATLRSKINLVLARHESGAAFIADGWSRGRLKPSLVLTTLGPGVTNVITGIATSFCDSIPLILITGQSETHKIGLGNFQDSSCINRGTDINALLRPITKVSLEAHTPEEAVNYIHIAYNHAISGRMGPAHISLPYDIQLKKITRPRLNSSVLTRKQENLSCVNDVLDINKILRNSKRPIILVGWGAYLSKATEKVIQFSEFYNIPIISTIKGKAVLSSTYHNYIGHVGPASTNLTKQFLKEYAPDLFVVLGSSLGKMTVNFINRYLENAKVIQVDLTAEQKTIATKINKFINCDVSLFLSCNLNKAKKKIDFSLNGWREIKQKIESNNIINTKEPFSFRIIEELNKIMPKGTIFLPDAGNHWLLSLNKTITKSSGAYFTGIGLASMGQAIGCAIGLKLAHPKKNVICLTGDGSMLMYGSEISTAVDLKLPVIFLVFNNASLGRIVKAQKEDFNNIVGGAFIPKVDFVKWGESLGANAFHPETIKEFKRGILDSLKLDKPTVADIDFKEIDKIPL